MSTYSKFLAILTGTDRQVDLSNTGNIFGLANLGLLGSASGVLTHIASASTTSYSLTWPAAQASGTQVLSNNGSGVLSWTTVAGVGTLGISAGGTGSTSFNTSAMIYSNGTNLVSDPNIVTDGSGNLTVNSITTSGPGATSWSTGQLLATAAGFALP